MAKHVRSRKLSLEILESRTVLAGNVTAQVIGGDLVIHGDNTGIVVVDPEFGELGKFGNSIRIDQFELPAGSYRISATDFFGTPPTTINGVSGPVVLSGVTSDVIITDNDADADTVDFFSTFDISIPGDLVTNFGNGFQSLELISGTVGGDVDVTTGSGLSKNLTIVPVSVGGEVNVNLGSSGGAQVGVSSAVGGDFTVNTGTVGFASVSAIGTIGGDYQVIGTNSANTFIQIVSAAVAGDFIVQGGGFDTITSSSQSAGTIGGEAILNVGGGGSDIDLEGISIAGDLIVAAGNGNDDVRVSGFFSPSSVGGEVEISTGDGTFNRVEIQGLTTSSLSVTETVGSHSLSIDQSTITDEVEISMTSPNNGTNIRQSTVGDLDYIGGTGSDTIFIGGSTVNGDAEINTGGGVGNILIQAFGASNTIRGDLTVLTGSGNDLVRIRSTTVEGDTTISTGAGSDQVQIGVAGTALTTFFLGNLNIDTGSGNDSVVINRTKVNGSTNVNTMAGDDSISIKDSLFIGQVRIDGGSGVDTFSDLGGNSFLGGLVLLNLP